MSDRIEEAAKAIEALGSVDCANFQHRLFIARAADAVLTPGYAEVVEALQEAEEYFDNRADADCDQDGYIPNAEMRLLMTVRAALAKATKP